MQTFRLDELGYQTSEIEALQCMHRFYTSQEDIELNINVTKEMVVYNPKSCCPVSDYNEQKWQRTPPCAAAAAPFTFVKVEEFEYPICYWHHVSLCMSTVGNDEYGIFYRRPVTPIETKKLFFPAFGLR